MFRNTSRLRPPSAAMAVALVAMFAALGARPRPSKVGFRWDWADGCVLFDRPPSVGASPGSGQVASSTKETV
jgi:hypothetical protein